MVFPKAQIAAKSFLALYKTKCSVSAIEIINIARKRMKYYKFRAVFISGSLKRKENPLRLSKCWDSSCLCGGPFPSSW